MTARLPIRARLAIVSTLLAAGMLAAGLLTVYLIEAHQVHQTLVADARAAAHDLAIAGDGAGRRGNANRPKAGTPPATRPQKPKNASSGGRATNVITPPPVTGSTDTGSSQDSADGESGDSLAGLGTGQEGGAAEDDAIKTYLGARSGSDLLLATISPTGRFIANNQPATRLVKQHQWPPVGGLRTINVDGDGYLVATAARGSSVVLAGLPVTEADAGVRRLLDAMLIVCLIGLVPAAVAAWWVARRALSPLSRIAQRASRVTAGDLSVRMGPVATQDEIGQVATAIDAMLDRLEIAFAVQRQFVHDASHELRTPLTIARGHLEVALPSEGSSPELRQAVGVAIGELDRMGRLVDSLLRVARAGVREGSERRPVDVSALARATVDRCRVLGKRTWQVQTTPEAYVDGDTGALEQVFQNLLSNAVRHTVAGDTITVSAIANDDRVRIEVADTGEGIDPELLATLFGRFTRADSARSRDTGGAGLGLAICHAIVDAHGGTIAAESPPGQGARFVVDMPRALPQRGNGHVRAVSPPVHV